MKIPRRRFLVQSEQDSLFRKTLENVGLVSLVLGFVVSIAIQPLKDNTDFFKSLPIIEPLLNEIGIALLIAAIIILTTEKHSRIEFNKLIQGQISTVDETIAKGLGRITGTMLLASFLEKLNTASPQTEIKLISTKIYDQYITGLRAIDESGFQVDDVNWALESNEIFYGVLYASPNFRTCEVRITHTGSIDTWLNFEKATVTLERQQRCIKEKDINIIRIFIGREELSDEDSDVYKRYVRVMEEMTKHSIRCYYITKKDPTEWIDMTWVPKLGLLSVWTPGVGGAVGSIKLTSDEAKRDYLDTTWKALLNNARPYDQIVSRSPPHPRPSHPASPSGP